VLFPPCESQSTPEVDGANQIDVAWNRNATILVIDDDDGSREVTADCLDYAGYRVVTASDGYAGVELFQKHTNVIELVILDRTMPRISGEETFDRIRAVDSEANVLLMSGYAERCAAESFTGKNLSGFIQKPFLPEALLKKVNFLIGISGCTAPRESSYSARARFSAGLPVRDARCEDAGATR
jgi:DNA-binding NtrC family response regulator